MDEDKTVKTVRSVERTLRILFCIAGARHPMSLSEIGAEVEIDKATTMRLLNTLETFRLVKRDPGSRKYSIGSAAWQLTSAYQSDFRLAAEPHLQALKETTGESASLVVERGLERVVVTSVEATHELRVVPTSNSVVPVYAGASGRVLMAFMPDEQRDRIISITGLKPVNARGLTDRQSYLASLDKVRANGYAVSLGDVTLGTVAVAAPVFDQNRRIRAVVSLRGPEARMTPDRIDALAKLVVEAADRIGGDLFLSPMERVASLQEA